MKRLILSAAVLAGLAITGTACTTTPFAPIAVPKSTSIRRTAPKNIAKEYAELEKLQRVVPGPYTLTPNDAFSVVVHGQEALSRPNVVVMPDGTVSIAPIGSVKVTGLTLSETAALLQKKYRKYVRDCEVVLEPVTLKPYRFTIGGVVKAPGIYPFVFGSFRLTDAVAMAQGLPGSGTNSDGESLADLQNAYISRSGRILPIDFTKALQGGDPLYNIPIMDGDYIYIPSLESGKVTVIGAIGNNCMPYRPDLTLLQTIALSGGLRGVTARELKVIRGGLKQPVVYNINIRDMQAGKIMDFPLEPKDIVFVPTHPVNEWNEIISLIMPTLQLLNSAAGPFGNPGGFVYNEYYDDDDE